MLDAECSLCFSDSFSAPTGYALRTVTSTVRKEVCDEGILSTPIATNTCHLTLELRPQVVKTLPLMRFNGSGLQHCGQAPRSFPKSKRGQMTDDAKDSLLYTIQTAGGADAACRAERERIAFS